MQFGYIFFFPQFFIALGLLSWSFTLYAGRHINNIVLQEWIASQMAMNTSSIDDISSFNLSRFSF